MSHWMTSGRSRLKAKQNESFSNRARQRAALVNPCAMMSREGDAHRPGDGYRRSNVRRYSGANPILRRGVVVSIGSNKDYYAPVNDYYQYTAPKHAQHPPQPFQQRRVHDPHGEQYLRPERIRRISGCYRGVPSACSDMPPPPSPHPLPTGHYPFHMYHYSHDAQHDGSLVDNRVPLQQQGPFHEQQGFRPPSQRQKLSAPRHFFGLSNNNFADQPHNSQHPGTYCSRHNEVPLQYQSSARHEPRNQFFDQPILRENSNQQLSYSQEVSPVPVPRDPFDCLDQMMPETKPRGIKRFQQKQSTEEIKMETVDPFFKEAAQPFLEVEEKADTTEDGTVYAPNTNSWDPYQQLDDISAVHPPNENRNDTFNPYHYSHMPNDCYQNHDKDLWGKTSKGYKPFGDYAENEPEQPRPRGIKRFQRKRTQAAMSSKSDPLKHFRGLPAMLPRHTTSDLILANSSLVDRPPGINEFQKLVASDPLEDPVVEYTKKSRSNVKQEQQQQKPCQLANDFDFWMPTGSPANPPRLLHHGTPPSTIRCFNEGQEVDFAGNLLRDHHSEDASTETWRNEPRSDSHRLLERYGDPFEGLF